MPWQVQPLHSMHPQAGSLLMDLQMSPADTLCTNRRPQAAGLHLVHNAGHETHIAPPCANKQPVRCSSLGCTLAEACCTSGRPQAVNLGIHTMAVSSTIAGVYMQAC